jgi:hypothetical protein
MAVIAAPGGLLLIVAVLWDAFETIVLPRRVTHRLRLTRLFYRLTWRPWSAVGRRVRDGAGREVFLSFYGSLSLILLIITWSVALIAGFALLFWSLDAVHGPDAGPASFGTALYISGTNFFTLGLGDVAPSTAPGRAMAVAEVGTGLGFVALVIGYLPVLYQAFSRREVNVSLLDARAGSPPSAVELLRRHTDTHDSLLQPLLQDWERWAAELLETHLSYPVLAYYRSQHEHQSWLAALTTILDVSALVFASAEGGAAHSARLTFAMARHAAVDLAQVFTTAPRPPEAPRLPEPDFARLHDVLSASGLQARSEERVKRRLTELRRLYEPYVNALAHYLLMPLPPWVAPASILDAWETSAWETIGARGAADDSDRARPDRRA